MAILYCDSIHYSSFFDCLLQLWISAEGEKVMNEQLYKDTDIRVIDQRIGVGIGGWNTVIRLCHKPTGILIEMPRLTRSQFYDRQLAFEMLEYALASDLKVGSDE
jgi:protein subunit release factor A